MGDDAGLWWVTTGADPERGVRAGEGVLTGVHQPSQCAGRPCVIHAPSAHHMRDWPLVWRPDLRMMERHCPHGIGHPDPDDLARQAQQGRGHLAAHACDGCCVASE
jgi:hypothetical protein